MSDEIKEYCKESSPILKENSINTLHKCCSNNSAQQTGNISYNSTLNNSHSLEDIQGRSDVAASQKTKKRFEFSKIPRRKKIVVCLCLISNFLASASYSILGPFFPLEAQKKDMNLTMIGLVFGLYQLVVFLTSPLMGNFMIKIGTKFMFISGISIGGCSAILFGFLNRGPGGNIFAVMCFLVRGVEAVGFSAFMTSSMAIVSSEFEEHAGSVVALIKVANALGNLVGPFLAGVLYDIGGFGLPLYCTGVLFLLNGVVIIFQLPTIQSKNKEHSRDTSILHLLKNPLVLISIMSLFTFISSFHFFVSIISTHLKPFGLSSIIVGALYMVGPLIYIPTTLIWGYITDVKDKQSVLIVSAHLTCCIGWSVIGPLPFVPFLPYSPVSVAVGYAIVETMAGCLMIVPMKNMLYGAYELNYMKGQDTLAMVSGLFTSVFALGGFTGPFVGGILSEKYGIALLFTGIALVHLFMFFVTLIFFLFRYLKRRDCKATVQVARSH